MRRLLYSGLLLGLTVSAGCIDSAKPTADEKKPAANPSANDGEGIFKKTTQDIGKFDPNAANQVVDDQKIHATDPITGPFSAYGPIVGSAVITKIKHDIDIFEASELHYPTYEEFMEKIIKENNIRLPVLPYKGRYMYNEATHELVVVRDIENAEKAK
jgi:hypothetical protein